jgi:D-3-phosphoglycerate dehydrogenase / 2-oxoglutarate reductase
MNLFFDFDSTIIQTESLDELAKMVLTKDQEKIDQFKEITKQGMKGELDFEQSLIGRLNLIVATKSDINRLILKLRQTLSPSIDCLKRIVEENRSSCFVVSGGFLDYLKPICIELGFLEDHIFGNDFTYDGEKIIGFNTENILAISKGKASLIQSLGLSSPVVIIGDGYTDYEVKLEAVADHFIGFTENISRQKVVVHADIICQNFNQVYNYINKTPSLNLF